MPQSLAQVYLHLVWSTKQRQPFLTSRGDREKLHAYVAGTCHNLNCSSLKVGGVEDHMHVLCRLSRTMSIADLVRDLKRASSGWVKTLSRKLKEFDWQNGYGAFSISPSHVEALKTYIRDQEIHHRRESFQDEFRRLLRKYGLEFDERYVWD